MHEKEREPGRRGGILFAGVLTVFLFGLRLLVCLGRVLDRETPVVESGRTDAYRVGGTPRTDTRVRRVVAELLPKLSAAGEAASMRGAAFAPERDRIARELRAPELASALDRDASAALSQLIARYAEHVDGRTDAASVRAAALRLDEALVARGLGYRVEAVDTGATTLALLGFGIDDVRRVHVDAAELRLLVAKRVDPLPVEAETLGFASADSDVLLLADDRIEVLARELGGASAREPMRRATAAGLAQRYVDLRREQPIPLPSSILAFHRPSIVAGPRTATSAATAIAVRQALASMATVPEASPLVPRMLLRCFPEGRRCDRDHENAARIVLAELAREFSMPDLREPQFLHDDELARLGDAISRRSSSMVSAASASAFERLFGDRPVVLR